MKLVMFSVKDIKAGAFSPVQCMPNVSVAQRSYANAMRSRPDCEWALNPSDFELFCVGQYDDVTGEVFVESDFPRFVCSFSSFVKE